jgi:hypothetical protein
MRLHQHGLPGPLAGGEVEGDEFFASVVEKEAAAEVELLTLRKRRQRMLPRWLTSRHSMRASLKT